MKSKQAVFKMVNGGVQGRLETVLHKLKDDYAASSLKLSTEDAAMSFEQIRFWVSVCSGIMPVVVKIGGPNARNDIKQLMAAKVDGLIAPMIESPFGLQNFMEALKDYTTPMQFEGLDKHINIETVTAMENLEKILDSDHATSLDEVTIGCHDLSRSMNRPVGHPEVLDSVKQAIAVIRRKGFTASVGGGISPAGIDTLIEDVQPQKFNTRIVTFDVHSSRSYRTAVKEAIEFEILMLNNDSRMGFISVEEEKFRIKQLKKRLSPSG